MLEGYFFRKCPLLLDAFNERMYLFLLMFIPLVYGDRIVTTNNGPVKGTSLYGKEVEAFLGVPYAEPPVGPLRFAKPVPKSSWDETYDADKLPPACVQANLPALLLNAEMQEDCLYLNLWVPEGGSNLKTIMVFIHGGGLMYGSSTMKVYDGAALSERGDVIVATINYRVGSLGFFSGFTYGADGNMGMHDQVMAIRWIKENARHFGGDSDNIVLFGESSGAVSISLHMVSPLSKNLFRRSILQSGSAFHPMFYDGNEELFIGSRVIANMSGCSDDNDWLKTNRKDIVDCMKQLPSEKFSEIDTIFLQREEKLMPRGGDDFLPINPIDLFRKGEFKDTEVLFGTTRDEGSLLLSIYRSDIFGIFGEKIDDSAFNDTFFKKIAQGLTKKDGNNEVIQSYLDKVGGESRYTYLTAMSDFLGDFLITCSAVYEADHRSFKKYPVYFYLFDYRSPSSPFADWMGVVHFEEIPYVFGNALYNNFTEPEEKFSKDVMDMWVAFAKTGNPSIPGRLEWPQYKYEDPKYYIISQRDKVGVRPDNYRCETWREAFRGDITGSIVCIFKNDDD